MVLLVRMQECDVIIKTELKNNVEVINRVMEIIIVLAIIVVLCLILDVSLNYIIGGALVLMCILFGLMAICFAWCCISFIWSKKKEARFVKFDKGKSNKYQVAYYKIDDEEYPCAFPREIVLQDKLYNADKTYHVLFNPRNQKVYDRFAITTCILGVMLCGTFVVGLLVFLFQ